MGSLFFTFGDIFGGTLGVIWEVLGVSGIVLGVDETMQKAKNYSGQNRPDESQQLKGRT